MLTLENKQGREEKFDIQRPKEASYIRNNNNNKNTTI